MPQPLSPSNNNPSLPEALMPNIDHMPPSDFKDLLIALLIFQTSYDQLASRLDDQAEAIIDLQRQACEIDAHYGWVLASDSVFIDNGEGRVKGWFRKTHENYCVCCQALSLM
jgi:hypothetical protein